jgi:hypothetical protein
VKNEHSTDYADYTETIRREALLQKSAKPTNESSPALQRWELAVSESEPAKRATEKSASLLNFQPSAARTMDQVSSVPSAKALGYYQSVRSKSTFQQSLAAKSLKLREAAITSAECAG